MRLILFFLMLNVTFCWADGRCKEKGIPPGYVAVKSFYSPECDREGDPFKKNAWELAPTAEGTVACALPEYSEITGKQVELVRCERTFSADCDDRSDGLENAVTLR